MHTRILRGAAIACLVMAAAAAQQPARTNIVGAVQSIDTSNGRITLKMDDGKTVVIAPHANARYLHVLPGQKMSQATNISPNEISTGDRLLARGELSEDKQAMAASTIVVMNKADIAKKQQADEAEWRARGVGGLVTAVDPAANTVTINTRTAEGLKPLIIVASAKTTISRYAPDSVKFSDAKPSTVAEIKVGDQVRALGTKSDDGMHYEADEMVSGAFRNVAATVTAIDPATNTLKVMDLTTRKPLIVHVNADSTMRKLPEMVARMIALRTSGAAAGAGAGAAGGGSWQGGGQRPAGQWQGGAAGGTGNGARGRGDVQQMLERMPAIKLEDLKPGDALIISSTQGADPNQVTAITLVAGVEPILSAAPGGRQRASMLGSWNLDMDMGGGMQ